MSVANTILIVGDPMEGIDIYGPYETGGEARATAEGLHDGVPLEGTWWISQLLPPGEVRKP